jgi:sugar phosphate permease
LQQRLPLVSLFSIALRFLPLASPVLSPLASSQEWMAWPVSQGGDGMSASRKFAALANNSRLFIVEGAVTALVAIVGFFMLPNTPLTTRWLTEREKQLAHERMEKDKVSDSEEGGSSWEGLKQACKDKRTWLFCLMQNFHLSACSFNSFFPT